MILYCEFVRKIHIRKVCRCRKTYTSQTNNWSTLKDITFGLYEAAVIRHCQLLSRLLHNGKVCLVESVFTTELCSWTDTLFTVCPMASDKLFPMHNNLFLALKLRRIFFLKLYIIRGFFLVSKVGYSRRRRRLWRWLGQLAVKHSNID